MTSNAHSPPDPNAFPSWRELDALERLRLDLLARVAALPEPDRGSLQVDGGGWTPVQVLQHLLRVEVLILDGMEKRRPPPRHRTLRHRLGGLLVRTIFLLGIRVRMPTRTIDPGPPTSLDEVASRWLGPGREVRSGNSRPEPPAPATAATPGPHGIAPELHRQLRDAEARDPAAPVMVHPVSGPLSPRATAAFLLQHMKHHERQLHRILSAQPRR